MSLDRARITQCRRCHRSLRSARSIAAGMGRYCQAKDRAERQARAVADFTEVQREKAFELIADKAIVPTSRPGVYRCVSTDGSTIYLCHYAGCTCPAGLRQRLCYHRAAVRMLAITKRKAA